LQRTAHDELEGIQDGAGVNMEECHETMAEIVVIYLSYEIFDTRVSTSRVPLIEEGGALSMVVKTATEGSKAVQSLALKLLARRKTPNLDLGKSFGEKAATRNPPKTL
jgi:hypothetical protein